MAAVPVLAGNGAALVLGSGRGVWVIGGVVGAAVIAAMAALTSAVRAHPLTTPRRRARLTR